MDLALYKVLIVEDDYFIGEDMKKTCEDAKCLVIGPARTEADALNIVENEIPDIAIVDLNLGNGVSMNVPLMLREHNIPFCFATGYDQASLPSGFETVPFLRKPVEKEALLKVISSALN